MSNKVHKISMPNPITMPAAPMKPSRVIEAKLPKSDKVKYVIYPGTVRSINDGQTHFINSNQLMQLYNVRPDECLIYPYISGGWSTEDLNKLKVLRPRYDGNYTLAD